MVRTVFPCTIYFKVLKRKLYIRTLNDSVLLVWYLNFRNCTCLIIQERIFVPKHGKVPQLLVDFTKQIKTK